MWLHLSDEAIVHLQSENFPFQSSLGAELFLRTLEDAQTPDDHSLLTLISLGTPISDVGQFPSSPHNARPTIEIALIKHRTNLVDFLISKGALNSNGMPDQMKIDSAFRAAIEGGHLGLVEKIWEISGSQPHPSLTMEIDNGGKAHLIPWSRWPCYC